MNNPLEIEDAPRLEEPLPPPSVPEPNRGDDAFGAELSDDLEEYARFNRDFLDAVRASKAAGHTVDEAVTALDLRTRYPDHTMDRAAANVQAIYDELDAP